MKEATLKITGMRCSNCALRISRQLNRLDGVSSVSVSYADSTAKLLYDPGQVSMDQLIEAVEQAGYQVQHSSAGWQPFLQRCRILLPVFALYIILQKTGILNLLAPSQVADSAMGYGMLFVLGLLTSVHCIAMCGGINLSQCLPDQAQQQNHPENLTGKKAALFRPSVLYNLGRVCSYTAIGFILGLAGYLLGGGDLVISSLLQGILKCAAGIFMILAGLNMLGLTPWLRKIKLRMPAGLSRMAASLSGKGPFITGLFNGLMPCGPLQAMWLVALASGNPLSGALSMFLFALGTVPLMLGFGSLVSALGSRFTSQVLNIGAILVVVLGLAMLGQGTALSGMISDNVLTMVIFAACLAGILSAIPFRKKYAAWISSAAAVAVILIAIVSSNMSSMKGNAAADSTVTASAEIVDGVQIVTTTLSSGSYPTITVEEGIPVYWVIDAPDGTVTGCNYKLQIPEYDLEYTLHTGENVIEFTPEETGTISYSCWMGMVRGSINVLSSDTSDTESEALSLGSEAEKGITGV